MRRPYPAGVPVSDGTATPAGTKVPPTLSTASTSSPASIGAARTSFTPARSARWRTSVESASTISTVPISGRERVRRSTATNPEGPAHEGPSSATNGVPSSMRSSSDSMVGNAAARTRSPRSEISCERSEGSLSMTATLKSAIGTSMPEKGELLRVVGDCSTLGHSLRDQPPVGYGVSTPGWNRVEKSTGGRSTGWKSFGARVM